MWIKYSDEELLEGLRQRKSKVIEYMYREYGLVLRHYLRQNSGTEEDVKDIFQDAITALYLRCSSPSFRLECGLKTFFMSVCRNLWLQKLDYKYRLLYQADLTVNEPDGEYQHEERDQQEDNLEIRRLMHKNLLKLPAICRRLIELYSMKVPVKQIALILNMKNDIYVRTRKYSCKNILRKRIMNDPEFKRYLCYERNGNYERLD